MKRVFFIVTTLKKHYSKPNSSDILYIFVFCSINRHWHPASALKHNIVDLYIEF